MVNLSRWSAALLAPRIALAERLTGAFPSRPVHALIGRLLLRRAVLSLLVVFGSLHRVVGALNQTPLVGFGALGAARSSAGFGWCGWHDWIVPCTPT